METLTLNKKRNNYVPESKPKEELEKITYLTGMSIEQIMDADYYTQRRIMAILLFYENCC